MKKRIPLVAILILILICSIGCLAACGGGSLKITAEHNGNGTVSVSAETAEPGESVTVTMTPDAGYCVESVLLNDGELEVEDNKAVFSMPNTDANISVTFGKIKYKLEITSVAGGEIDYKAEGYAEGESVTLSVKPDYGYALSSLTVGGSSVTVTDNKYTFTMPANAVAVVPAFTSAVEVKALPSGSVLEFTSQAPAGGLAKATLFAEFGAEALEVRAFVEDGKIITAKDGMTFCFGTSDFADGAVTDGNVKVQALTSGAVTVTKAASGEAIAEGVTATIQPWSKESGKVTGYEINISAAYSVLGVTAADAQGRLTMLPVLTNGDKTGLAFGAAETAIDEYHSVNNADTYPVLTSSGLSDNRYMFGQGEFGAYKGVVAKGTHWDISKDYDSSNADYANRKVTLNGHDGDNNIAMFRSAGKTSYAQAKFKVTEIYSKDDAAPKFGFMVFDTASVDSGVFYYVDAKRIVEGGKVGDIVGTGLGYVGKSNGSWLWSGEKLLANTTGSFNLATKEVTLGVTYNKGFIYLYCGDNQVGVTTYKAKGDVVIGVKSFGLGLELTDYFATNDPNSKEFKDHNERVDGTTVGDSESGDAYTEGWSIVGDIATNSGSGDQKLYIKGIEASRDLYAEAKITTPNRVEGSTDEWTKAGVMLENENYLVFGYTDLRSNASAADRVKTYFAIRNLASGAWTWDLGITSDGTTIEDKEVVFGIAKLGATVYLLQNGQVVATYTNQAIANEKFVAGVMGMNRYMMASAGYATNKTAEINEKLGSAIDDTVKFDGVLDDAVWTEEVLNSAVTFNADNRGTTGAKVEVAAVMGDNGVYVAVTLYTLTMQSQYPVNVHPEVPANVSFHFKKMNEGNKKTRPQFISFYNYLDGGVTASSSISNAAAKVESTTLSSGKEGYKTTVEFYVSFKNFDGYIAGATRLPFYVWTMRVDNVDYGAMNGANADSYKTQECYVTANGLTVIDK